VTKADPTTQDGVSTLLAPHAARPFAFLLDSRDGSRASYVGSRPVDQLVVDRQAAAHRWTGAGWARERGDAFDAIGRFVEESSARPTAAPGGLRAVARTVGYLSYELGCLAQGVEPVPIDPVGAPLAVLSTYPSVQAFDPETARVWTIEFQGIERRKSHVEVPSAAFRLLAAPAQADSAEATARAAYRRGFARIAAAIRAGEIYQANLTRTIRLPFRGDPLACYLRLRARQPVPYGAYLDLGELQILSNSPECFLRIEGDLIETAPIKGTRARGDDAASDAAAVASLRADPKERAEHIMIVDLERNDLGRICETGSVEVAEHGRVLTLATVHHLESTVRGRLRHDVGAADLLRATYPGGSVTGAPKIQAMRTIAEVEPFARGVYTGSIVAFNGARAADMSIAIRTAVVSAGHVSYGTGGGIVADSDPEREYEETVTKSRAFLDSLVDEDSVAAVSRA
jgi:para-aminobenzoate synthetase component 1